MGRIGQCDTEGHKMSEISQFPHCDTRILHAPGQCRYCDNHPEWQALREAWGIAFTGQDWGSDEEGIKLPCPADLNRPPGSDRDHRRWGGNVSA